jgi:hypothetical protein
MKTTIKTLLAITLIAALALAALSCSTPEVELTERDWSEITAGKDSSQIGVGTGAIPAYSALTQLVYSNAISDADKEITIWLPKEADVLKQSNSALTSELAKFLTFHTYTKAASGTTNADTLGAALAYTFVSRTSMPNSGVSGFNIKVRLNTLPDQHYLVMKIEADKYTYSDGKKICGGYDTKSGSDYYDIYTTINVTGATQGPASTYDKPHKDWVLYIVSPSFGTFVSGTSGPQICVIAALSGSTITDAIYDAVTPGLVSKISLEKFEDNSWKKVSLGANDIKYNPSTPSTTYSKYITLSFTPEEFALYRIKATGLENLETSANYYGVKQRINIGDYSTFSPKGFSTTNFESDPDYWKDSSKNYEFGDDPTSVSMEYDAGNSAILRMKFDTIVDSFPLNTSTLARYGLKELNLADFKKNVKIFYYRNSSLAGDAKEASDNVIFLDITGVKYIQHSYNDLAGTGKTNYFDEIEVTLNAGNQFDSSKWYYLYLGRGFKYTHDNILYGNPANWKDVKDGLRFSAAYGSF